MGLLSRKWVWGYEEGAIVQKVGLSQSRMGLLSKNGSVAIKSGSVVQKVGLRLSKVGLLSMEWVCGELEWICRPENKSVAF